MRKLTCMIVAGAVGNHGRLVAVSLARQRGNLFCVDKTSEALDPLVQSLPAESKTLAFSGTDLGKPAVDKPLMEAAVDSTRGIKGLVNTVGGFAAGPVEGDAPSVRDQMMNLNSWVALATSIAVQSVMQAARYGRIVHIAAGAGLKVATNQAAYAASKAAVLRRTESIAAQLRVNPITANCMLPGMIKTPQNCAAIPVAKVTDWVSRGSIARLITFLVSAEAAVVTSAVIPATGLE